MMKIHQKKQLKKVKSILKKRKPLNDENLVEENKENIEKKKKNYFPKKKINLHVNDQLEHEFLKNKEEKNKKKNHLKNHLHQIF